MTSNTVSIESVSTAGVLIVVVIFYFFNHALNLKLENGDFKTKEETVIEWECFALDSLRRMLSFGWEKK